MSFDFHPFRLYFEFMNGCLFFTISIFLLHWQLGERSKPLLNTGFWRAIQKCLAARDYLFRAAALQTPLDHEIKARLLLEIKRGSLRAEDLEALDEFCRVSDRQQSELKGLLGTYSTHLGFVLLVPFAFRILLLGRWSCEQGDLWELSAAFLGLLVIGRLLLKCWPMPTLGTAAMLQDFVGAYLGDQGCGPWAKDLAHLTRMAWLHGIDSRAEQRQLLKEWHVRTTSAFEQRRIFLQNCLGPGELLTSCYFGSCLMLGPLLNHFSRLVPGA